MADKKISELDLALLINNDAEFPFSQDNAGEPTTFKGRITQLGTKIAEDMTFSNLRTTSKKLVGAINELLSLGNPIILGTSAPTSSQGANGNLYIQYTAGTGGADDTVDGIYVKIDGAWCEISTGGGSGAGGHTIVDNAGTSLPQRTNLQFKGAYSEDNSTDDTTEVNVVREMTKAEFDLLSADEKTGFINITDITGGNDDRFQPVIYSEEEREIGVWVDGKPVYQKTIDFGSDITVNYNGWTETTEDCSSVDKYLYGDGYTSGGTYGGNILCSKKSNDKLEVQTARNGTSQIIRYLTVRYTKTTDQAGSGQWTPQGVPTHHYSTDERVVGTWIDGSTLYEKTVISTSNLSRGEINQIALGITDIDVCVSVNGFASYGANNTFVPLPYGNKGNSLICLMNINKALGLANVWVGEDYTSPSTANLLIITLQYTKSST